MQQESIQDIHPECPGQRGNIHIIIESELLMTAEILMDHNQHF